MAVTPFMQVHTMNHQRLWVVNEEFQSLLTFLRVQRGFVFFPGCAATVTAGVITVRVWVHLVQWEASITLP